MAIATATRSSRTLRSGAEHMGARTLYAILRRLLAVGLIDEVEGRADHQRRRYYLLTRLGSRRRRTPARRCTSPRFPIAFDRLLVALAPSLETALTSRGGRWYVPNGDRRLVHANRSVDCGVALLTNRSRNKSVTLVGEKPRSIFLPQSAAPMSLGAFGWLEKRAAAHLNRHLRD
jgi:hypothetical protein